MLGFLRHPNLQLGKAKCSKIPSRRLVGWGDEGTPTQSTFEDRG